jgi:predicted peroxiredoxin
MSSRRSLSIQVACGVEAPERLSQAFNTATIAMASGIDVSLWLSGGAADFALAGNAEKFDLPHAAPLAQALASLIEGATVTLCSQCAKRRNINDGDQIPGIRIAGSAAWVEEITQEGVQALVY